MMMMKDILEKIDIKCLECSDQSALVVLKKDGNVIFVHCPNCNAGQEGLKKYREIHKTFIDALHKVFDMAVG